MNWFYFKVGYFHSVVHEKPKSVFVCVFLSGLKLGTYFSNSSIGFQIINYFEKNLELYPWNWKLTLKNSQKLPKIYRRFPQNSFLIWTLHLLYIKQPSTYTRLPSLHHSNKLQFKPKPTSVSSFHFIFISFHLIQP